MRGEIKENFPRLDTADVYCFHLRSSNETGTKHCQPRKIGYGPL